MKLHLKRKQEEKIWNVLNEIKERFLSGKKPMALPLLGGLALKAHKEGLSGAELKIVVEGRIWSFEYLEYRGIINKLKSPKAADLKKGQFVFTVDEGKLDKALKSHSKSYKAKATAYQNAKIDEADPIKYEGKIIGKFITMGTKGYLAVDRKKVCLGKKNTRKSKLVAFLSLVSG